MGLRKRASKDAGDAADTLPAAASLKGAGGPPALIDAKSRADYKKEFDNHRLQNKHATGEWISPGIDLVRNFRCAVSQLRRDII